MTDENNILALSDEDFINQSILPLEEKESQEQEDEETPPVVESIKPLTEDPEEGEEEEEEEEDTQEPEDASESPSETQEEPPEDEEVPTSQVDYKGFYERLTGPIKANGKTLEIKSADEIVTLMQQGANYAQKMQKIAPYRKVIATLEKEGLLDEQKINYLIDLSRQDKRAITKLLKDSKTDPIDIDLDANDEYTPNNHQVTDQEVAFQTALDDIKQLPQGLDLLKTIQTTWDEQSKDILWNQPDTLHVLYEQKESGLYDYVVSEIERARLLGKVAPNAPFVAVYRDASEDLYKQGKLNGFLKPENQHNPKPVAKTVSKRPSIRNHKKAQAASTVNASKTAASVELNPLSMSDEEFLKLMAQSV